MSAASDVRFPGGFFTWQSLDNFGENFQSGWESWELPCRRIGAAATASSPSHGFYCLGYCEGREGGRGQRKKGGERKRRSLIISAAFLRVPLRSPRCHPRTMHLLEVLSLSCCLAAGAVLLGPRQPAAAAAYESGQGYYEEEPDAGEAKVSPCPRCRCQLAPLGMWLRVPLNGRLGNPTKEKIWEKPFQVGGFLKSGGRNFSKSV